MRRSAVRRFLRGTRRAARLPPREILTTLRVAFVIAVVELLIRWVSLPRLSRLLGVRINLGPANAAAEVLALEQLPPTAQRQLRCTRRVADVWPFSKGPCLRRALVGGHLLHDLDPAVRLGVAAAGDQLLAHAWLEIGDRPLETVDGFALFQHTPTGVSA